MGYKSQGQRLGLGHHLQTPGAYVVPSLGRGMFRAGQGLGFWVSMVFGGLAFRVRE